MLLPLPSQETARFADDAQRLRHNFGKDRCRPTGSSPNLPTELASQPSASPNRMQTGFLPKSTSSGNGFSLPLGHHTLGMGVLSTGVDRMLVENRVGVDQTRSSIIFFAPIKISHHGSEKKNSRHGSEPPVAGTGHPGFYPEWRILPTRPATSLQPSKSAVFGVRIKT